MDYLELSQSFIDQSMKAASLRELATLFYDTIKTFGCTHFVCLSHVDALNPPDDAVVLSNYPIDWAYYHSENQYHKIDPVLETCKHTITPFTWSNETWRAMLDFQKIHILNEAAEFELGEGHTIPIHTTEGYPASCSVVFQPGEVEPQALLAIQIMSVYLYEAAMKIHVGNKVRRPPPTVRQSQCLEFIAQGKSDWAISKILGISENTVRYHVKAILKHYGVGSRNQAVIRALFSGDITYMDIKATDFTTRQEITGFVHLDY